MNEQKAKCEATEKRESERRQVEEKKHNEEIQFLKRTNQQLKVINAQAGVEVPTAPRPSPMGQAFGSFSMAFNCLSTCTAKE